MIFTAGTSCTVAKLPNRSAASSKDVYSNCNCYVPRLPFNGSHLTPCLTYEEPCVLL